MAEISQLEYLVASSQKLLRKQVKRFMDQVEELEMSDRVIEKLIGDLFMVSSDRVIVRVAGNCGR